ncbi:ATP-binding cassette domain-containing protein [Apilactobacillus apisilvae]|uniref:ATP-binding cassette domain-containing protein n=1 Tax=Apilactobacillus apisilvae TaxID=2923364 RepID=A0ABY4PGY2_9LACO|nr:ATP-binding cassette domain-containing protein [Apilactobacillus apisilvae]UQS84759.1 ATP-binding cassette domain-containing protein [Apilactobacillus apisilvae]
MQVDKQPLLSINNLNVAVKERNLIHNLSFEIYPQTLTCITGENGVGKTTMVKAILKNFNKNDSVRATIKRSQLQYVPQFRNIDNDYPLTVRDFIGLGLQKSIRPWLSKKEKQVIQKIIKMTNLQELAKTPLGKCSGGEQQRVFLAQALVSDPKLLILDESTASLDKEAKFLLLDVVKEVIKQTGTAVIFITHDPILVKTYGDFDLNISNHHGMLSALKGVK